MYVVGTQKNHLNEMVFFEHPKHEFRMTVKKIIIILETNISAHLEICY